MGKPWGFPGNPADRRRAPALGGHLAPGYRFPMLYRFHDFELDFSRMQLRRSGDEIAVEPRPFSLLCLLVQNHDRLISKDEVIEHVWNGRVVSEAAVSTVVKTARRALDDDGDTQTYIRTVPRRGYRFVGPVRLGAAASPAEPLVPAKKPVEASEVPNPDRKPSIAIVPFRTIGEAGTGVTISEALPSELISSLSRLRWLTVLARGSTFRFRNAAYNLTGVRDLLSAGYCLSGDVECQGQNLAINVELADTDSQAVIWSDRFTGKTDDVHEIRARIIANVIASLELHIPQNEVEKIRLRSGDMLDALGPLSPRRSLHVSVQSRRQRHRARPFQSRHRTGPEFRACLCRPLLHPLPKRLPAFLAGVRIQSASGTRLCRKGRIP
ncbi:MAG: winged helix-turn-helix domain-containing protein [Pseudomonadota bacterium]